MKKEQIINRLNAIRKMVDDILEKGTNDPKKMATDETILALEQETEILQKHLFLATTNHTMFRRPWISDPVNQDTGKFKLNAMAPGGPGLFLAEIYFPLVMDPEMMKELQKLIMAAPSLAWACETAMVAFSFPETSGSLSTKVACEQAMSAMDWALSLLK